MCILYRGLLVTTTYASMGRVHGCHIWTAMFTGDVSTAREHGRYFGHPCSRAVDTAHEDDPWTRV